MISIDHKGKTYTLIDGVWADNTLREVPRKLSDELDDLAYIRREVSPVESGLCLFVGLVAGVLIATLLSGCDDSYKQIKASEVKYCEMRALYDQTNGEFGWPAYRGVIADKECKASIDPANAGG